MNGLELRKTSPGLRQKLLNPRHITGRQIGIRLHVDVTVRGSHLQPSHLRVVPFAEVHPRHPVAQVQLAAALLDVIQDRAREPPVGGSLEQIELGGFSLRREHHEDGQHAAG